MKEELFGVTARTEQPLTLLHNPQHWAVIHSEQSTGHRVECTVYNIQCTFNNIQSTENSVQYTVYIDRCVVFSSITNTDCAGKMT